MIYETHPDNPNPRAIQKGIAALERGDLIAYATDTVYGLGSLTKSEFKIYPNPNNGEFVIEASNDEVVMITNELGQPIKIFKLNSEINYSTKVSGLAAGIYFVAGNQFREKVVITK